MTEAITWDGSIRHMLQKAGSASPTPGGGSVAALAAALGPSMASMVANLSQGEKFAHIQAEMAAVLDELTDLTAQCETLFHEDMETFEQYMQALKLPRDTDGAIDRRRQAIREATVQAIEAPLRLIEACRKGLRCAHGMVGIANKQVISDLGIGAILFEAAAQSALLTVEINLASLKDEEQRSVYAVRLSESMSEIEQLKSSTLQETRRRMA
ncbi:MAG: Formiminotransferase-cyclodeaminase [Paenibacillus sp.]|nr:Formiminotransferase-cyclodeaminase [Paenibacillus sp.]